MSRHKRRTRLYRTQSRRLESFVVATARRLSDDDQDLADDLAQEGRIGAWLRADAPARTRVERARRIRRAAVNRMLRFLVRDALQVPAPIPLEKLARAANVAQRKRAARAVRRTRRAS
jgi:hypothetical protein